MAQKLSFENGGDFIVETRREVEQYLHYFCGDAANPQALTDTEPLRISFYKSVAAFVRAYADIAQNLTDAFLLLLFPADLNRRHLRVAPVVEDADLMHALDRASRRTPLFGFVLALEVFHRVILEKNSGDATLLRTPVHLALFANVEIARP